MLWRSHPYGFYSESYAHIFELFCVMIFATDNSSHCSYPIFRPHWIIVSFCIALMYYYRQGKKIVTVKLIFESDNLIQIHFAPLATLFTTLIANIANPVYN